MSGKLKSNGAVMESPTDLANKTGLSRCRRCGGLMAQEQFYDWMSDNGRLDFRGARCLICGEIVDPLIVAHRHERREPEPESHHRHYPRQG